MSNPLVVKRERDEQEIVEENSDFFIHDGDELIIYDGEEESIEGDPIGVKQEEFHNVSVFEETPVVRYRNRYTNEQKKEIIKVAEQSSNKQAAKQFSVDESCIRKWRTMKYFNEKPSTSSSNPLEFHDVKPIVKMKGNVETVTPKKTRKAYTAGRKLDVINYAEVTGNRQAAKIFDIDESCIRKWRLQKEMLIDINRERGTKRKPNLHWAELEKALKNWVLEQMNEGILLKPKEIRERSIEMAKEMNIQNFRGTSSYIFKFMERYHIPGRQGKKGSRKKVKEEVVFIQE